MFTLDSLQKAIKKLPSEVLTEIRLPPRAFKAMKERLKEGAHDGVPFRESPEVPPDTAIFIYRNREGQTGIRTVPIDADASQHKVRKIIWFTTPLPFIPMTSTGFQANERNPFLCSKIWT